MKRRGDIIIWIVLIIVGSFLMIGSVFAMATFRFRGGELAKSSSGLGPISVSDSCVTPLLPRIIDEARFTEAINEYMRRYNKSGNSPFHGLSGDFVKAGIEYGINPAWEINIARKESSFGTAGIATKGTHNAFGRKAVHGQPYIELKGVKWYKYDSFQSSIYGQAQFLKRRYIDKGLTTFETITEVYAPRSENDTDAYIAEMKDWVGEVVALAGSALQCEDVTSQITGATKQ